MQTSSAEIFQTFCLLHHAKAVSVKQDWQQRFQCLNPDEATHLSEWQPSEYLPWPSPVARWTAQPQHTVSSCLHQYLSFKFQCSVRRVWLPILGAGQHDKMAAKAPVESAAGQLADINIICAKKHMFKRNAAFVLRGCA